MPNSTLAAVMGSLVLWTGIANAAQSDPPCKGNPRVVDRCFGFHGRLAISNGAFNIRIWVVATHHMLTVFDLPRDTSEEVPPVVRDVLRDGAFDNVVFGNYEVCPLEKFRAGRMQTVCVERATNLMLRRWADIRPG
jgi:hypothetical protein